MFLIPSPKRYVGLLKFLESLLGGNVVYYPGCMTKWYLKDIYRNYRKLLRKFAPGFIEVPELQCCGSPLRSLGFLEEFEEVKKRNLKIIEEYAVKKMIFNCPACMYMFKEHYGLQGIKMVHACQIFAEKLPELEERKIKVTYHDPCHLGRYLGIYEEPRKVLKLLGFELVEMKHSKAGSLCCGGGGGLRTLNPEISAKIAALRIKEAMITGAELLVTACPMCYVQLKEAAEAVEAPMEVKELSEVVIDALREG